MGSCNARHLQHRNGNYKSSRWWSHHAHIWTSSSWSWLSRTQMMMVVLMIMIALYMDDDECHHDHDQIVHRWWWSYCAWVMIDPSCPKKVVLAYVRTLETGSPDHPFRCLDKGGPQNAFSEKVGHLAQQGAGRSDRSPSFCWNFPKPNLPW